MLVCAALQVGVFCGVPMRPEQIQELMFQMNLPKLAHVIPDEEAGGDGNDDGPDGEVATSDPE
jgi:hypothetical protein